MKHRISTKLKTINLKLLGSYLLRGIFILGPILLTVYSIYYLFVLIDSPIQNLFYQIFGRHFYGLGILTTIVLLISIGYLGSTIFMDSVFKPLEHFLSKIPIVSEMYKALKDIFGAFVSDKKKFEKPVLVTIYDGIYRIGFITNEDLEEFEIDSNIIAVYFPLSYAFTGELLLVNRDKVKLLNSEHSGSLMKFAISGGLVNAEEEDE